MNKTIIAVIIVIVAVAAGWYILAGHIGSGSSGNEAVAIVNGATITRHQLTMSEMQIAARQGEAATSTAVQAQLQPDALNLLIEQTLLEQAAEKAGAIASSTEVDSQLASAKGHFSTQADYDKALAAQGMTEGDFRTYISKNILINAYLEQQLNLAAATATPAEIQAAYTQVKSQQGSGANIPPLNQVRDQVAQMIVQQKQQQAVNDYIAQLRSAANIQILIATSTPAV